MFRVRFIPEATRLIAKLPPEIKQLIRSAIDNLREDPHGGAELTGEFAGYRSLKSRRYRIIYRVDEDDCAVEVYHVGHRRDVYESLRALLEQSLGPKRR
jgi:addiction module RelE/StbE family toxin